MPIETSRPVAAGVVTALVGFTSAFVVVLQGLTAVGATHAQAASGLLAVTILMGLTSFVLSLTTRLPITVAWSTPGAALLASTGTVDGGWPAAIGAFVVTGVLVLATGLVPALGSLITRIPASVAQAMLAGIVMQLCLGSVTGMAANPWAVGPVVLVWVLALWLAPRWASPLAFVAAAVVIAAHLARSGAHVDTASLVPRLELTAPTLTLGGLVGVALPLYLVTMASQNVPGVAVMRASATRCRGDARCSSRVRGRSSGRPPAGMRSTSLRSAPRWPPVPMPGRTAPAAGSRA